MTMRPNYCNDPSPEQPSRWFVVAVDCVLMLFIVVMCLNDIRLFVADHLGYDGWGVSELMVNYGGGPVRRGLPGQMLYLFCTATGIPPYPVIMTVCAGVFVAVMAFLVRNCRRYHVRLWLFVILLQCIVPSIVRKDFIMLAMYICMLMLCRSRCSLWVRYTGILLLSTVMLLSYEPVVFMILPLMVLVLWSDRRLPRLCTYLYVATIAICTLSLLALTGNSAIAGDIHSSWQSAFPEVGDTPGATIRSMAWDLRRSLEYNNSVLLPHTPASLIWQRVVMLLVWPLLYIRYMFMAVRPGEPRMPCRPATFTALVWIILVCDLPLLLGLSCDYGRLLTQALLVSMSTAFVLDDYTDRMLPAWLERAGNAIYGLYRRIPLNIYSLMGVMLVFAAPYSGYEGFGNMFRLSVVGHIVDYAIFLAGALMAHVDF